MRRVPTNPIWEALELLLAAAKRSPAGAKPALSDRDSIEAVLYRARTGLDFLPWRTAYNYFQWFDADGTWQEILDALRERVRVAAGREPTPSAAAVDSQSVKTAEGGAERGTDGGKRVRGRKRHILVGTLGLLIAVAVTAANVDDGRAAPLLFGLYSVVALLCRGLPGGSIRWPGKADGPVTFSDTQGAVRRWLWADWVLARADAHAAM